MIKISLITVFPELYENFIKTSLIARAVEQEVIKFNFVKFSDMCKLKKRIDEPTVGPGAGMIIKPEIVEKAITKCQEKDGPGFKIFFSPQGDKLDQRKLHKIYERFTKTFEKSTTIENPTSENQHLILICSRYEGIDDRVENYYADMILSIGDYVLMGGDLPAQVFLESFLRLFPNIVGRQESVQKESFQGPFLDYPEYGLPVSWKNMKIPEILRSGNHAQIETWRKEQACKKTILNRFDWFRESQPDTQDIELSRRFIPPHYVALMHSQVYVKDETVGHTSIASLDIHDIARSCTTYGIKNFFIITQLKDQSKIVTTFLDFWRSTKGKEYNKSRFQAIQCVQLSSSLDLAIEEIKNREGVSPIIITTSAKNYEKRTKIDFISQSLIWKKDQPVLIIFGTGRGLSEEIIKKSDFIFTPLKGISNYNHLSVRSAVAIVLDRWLGLKATLS